MSERRVTSTPQDPMTREEFEKPPVSVRLIRDEAGTSTQQKDFNTQAGNFAAILVSHTVGFDCARYVGESDDAWRQRLLDYPQALLDYVARIAKGSAGHWLIPRFSSGAVQVAARLKERLESPHPGTVDEIHAAVFLNAMMAVDLPLGYVFIAEYPGTLVVDPEGGQPPATLVVWDAPAESEEDTLRATRHPTVLEGGRFWRLARQRVLGHASVMRLRMVDCRSQIRTKDGSTENPGVFACDIKLPLWMAQ